MTRWSRWTAAVVGLAALWTAAPAHAELPDTLDEFKEYHAEIATTPEGAAKALLDAMFVYRDEDTRDEGRKMVAYIWIQYKDDNTWDKKPSNHTMVNRILEKPEILNGYANGTTPENGYEMDPNDYEITIDKKDKAPEGDLGLRLYLHHNGADSGKPIYFKQSTKSELWYVASLSSLYSGVRPPVDPDKEVFE